jgi:hypothetical protein
MTLDELHTLKNFHINEKDIYGRKVFGNYEGIKFELMQRMDAAANLAKYVYGDYQGQFIIHDINLGDHGDKSYHPLGLAIDGHFHDLNLFHSTLILMKAGFKGIGMYPDWNYKGNHADIRDQDHVSTWVRHNNKYIYDWNYWVEQLELEIECPDG